MGKGRRMTRRIARVAVASLCVSMSRETEEEGSGSWRMLVNKSHRQQPSCVLCTSSGLQGARQTITPLRPPPPGARALFPSTKHDGARPNLIKSPLGWDGLFVPGHPLHTPSQGVLCAVCVLCMCARCSVCPARSATVSSVLLQRGRSRDPLDLTARATGADGGQGAGDWCW